MKYVYSSFDAVLLLLFLHFLKIYIESKISLILSLIYDQPFQIREGGRVVHI